MSEPTGSDTDNATIVALATPPGRGGVGIVRVSGGLAGNIAKQILGARPRTRRAVLRIFKDRAGNPIDEGIAIFFAGPSSFTGEDVLELQGHGGPVVLDLLVSEILSLGARPARPGEFSERAYLNDRLDLAQAEAIADLIDSGSTEAARAALRSMQGEFSVRVSALVESITELRAYVEAAIDFPEEEVDFLSDEALLLRLQAVFQQFDDLQAATRQGCLLRDGMTVVIAGRPNAGKSSLLNCLAGYDAAIVTDTPGTTRDVLRERINIDGMPLHIMDTAGLRESHDAIEREGVRRAHAEVSRADRVLLIVDASNSSARDTQALLAQLSGAAPITIVQNKIDLTNEENNARSGGASNKNETCATRDATQAPDTLWVSAKSGAGVNELRAYLKRVMGYENPDGGTLSARRRHLTALMEARAHVEEGRRQLLEARAGELMAEELRQAQSALAEITGDVSSDELLGKIFSSFCIGK